MFTGRIMDTAAAEVEQMSHYIIRAILLDLIN